MANKIVIEVVSTSKGLKMTTKEIEGVDKAQKKVKKSRTDLEKGTGRFNKQEKALYQTNLSTAKSFSKMNQTMGGSTGLVATYAILAANVFAATAAFNTFRSAMAVEKLEEGLRAFSTTSGQSLDIVSAKLQEATGNAVSFEQAMRTAALSTSAGFGTAEMEGLTKVAKGASLALGRDMGDALDRLTRGAIKLEPEILDELGIMVRLDDATESYAATLGKSASQLTRFERQQAFMNAIITEGEEKFGDIADSIDPNVYDQLMAAFTDLTTTGINLINFFLKPVIGLLMSSAGLFAGLATIAIGMITRRMVPALGDMAKSAAMASARAVESMQEMHRLGGESARTAREGIKVVHGMPEGFAKYADAIKTGTASTRELGTAQGALTRQIKTLKAKPVEDLTSAEKKLLTAMESNRKKILEIKAARVSPEAQRGLSMLSAEAEFYDKSSLVMAEASRQAFGFSDNLDKIKNVYKGVTDAAKTYWQQLVVTEWQTKKVGWFTKGLRTTLAALKVAFRTAGLSAKAFGTMLLQAIPFIGQILSIAMILLDVFKWLARKLVPAFSEESQAAKESWKDMNSVIESMPDKFEQIAKNNDRASASAETLTKNYKILGGLSKTVLDQARETAKAMKDAGDGPDDDAAVGSGFRVWRSQLGKAMKDAKENPFAAALLEMEAEPLYKEFIEKQLGGVDVAGFIKKAMEEGATFGAVFDKLETTLQDAEVHFNGLAQAIEGMQANLKEAEKEVTKFFSKLAQTTKYDDLSRAFGGILNDLNAIDKETSEMAGMDRIAALVDVVDSLGSGMIDFLGPEVVSGMELVTEAETELNKLRKEALYMTKEELVWQDQIIKQQDELLKNRKRDLVEPLEEAVKARKTLINTLREEILFTKSLEKSMKIYLKQTKAITKNAQLQNAELIMNNVLNKRQIRQLERELQLYSGILAQIAGKQKAGKDLNERELDTLRKSQQIEMDIIGLRASRVSFAERELRLQLGVRKEMQEQLTIVKELQSVTIDNIQKLNRLQAFRVSGREELSGAQQLTEELKIANFKYKMGKLEANVKFAVIEAEHNLLVERAKIAKLENLAAIARGDITAEESAALLRLNEALSAQVKTSEENVDVYKKVRNALLEGLEMELKLALRRGITDMGNIFTQTGGGTAIAQAFTGIFGQENAKLKRQRTLDEIEENKESLKNFKDLTEKKKKINEQITAARINIGAGAGKAGEEELERLKAERSQILLALVDLTEGSKDYEQGVNDRISQLTESASEYEMTLQDVAQTMSLFGQIVVETFGERGLIVGAIANFGATVTDLVNNVFSAEEGKSSLWETILDTDAEREERLGAAAEGLNQLGNLMGSIGAIAAASANAKIKAIDQEIEAEKKRDGKSKESLARIATLEKKKEARERKAFETNKKLMMAQTVVNTAAAIMATLKNDGAWAMPIALMIGALGAAQLAIIAGTSWQGGGAAAPSLPAKIEVGERTNRVDVSQGASAGELAYLRGQRGIGSGPGSFSAMGGASGLRKNYAAGGEILVGEQGPEIIRPMSPMEVVPNDALGGKPVSAHFTINAIDAAGVEEVLMEQQGNIISMIRSAANDYGVEFLETVNTDTYGSPKSAGGIDY